MLEAEPTLHQPPIVVVIDVPGSDHARAIAHCARPGPLRAQLRWIPPDLALPGTLRALDSVDAVCLPLGVRGTSPQDLFLLALADGIARLRARGVLVFVACGSHRDPNELALVTGAISVGPLRGRRHPARLYCPDLGAGSSGASLRAAVVCAHLRTRRLLFRSLRR